MLFVLKIVAGLFHTLKNLTMNKLHFVAVIAVLIAACEDKANDRTSLNSADKLFLQEVSYSNHAEIIEGGIAVANGNLDTVKAFGNMMIADHSPAQAELESLAGRLDFDIPSTPDTAHQSRAVLLQSLSGNVFDTTYIGGQVRDHKYTISIFDEELQYGNNLEIINYANKYLPMIQSHLKEAQDIDDLLH